MGRTHTPGQNLPLATGSFLESHADGFIGWESDPGLRRLPGQVMRGHFKTADVI